MVPANCLFNAVPTIHMPATCYIAVSDRIETDSTLELMLKFLSTYSETVLVQVYSLLNHPKFFFII